MTVVPGHSPAILILHRPWAIIEANTFKSPPSHSPLKPTPSTISSCHRHRTPCTEPPWVPTSRQQPPAAPWFSCHRGDLHLDPTVLVDRLSSGLNRSSVLPPSFPAAQFESPWRSYLMSFFVPLRPP
jgi:hypothetical protein